MPLGRYEYLPGISWAGQYVGTITWPQAGCDVESVYSAN